MSVACVTDSKRESRASVGSARANEPVFELTSSDAPWPVEYSSDPLWTRAAGGDDFDLARLARREGAEGLLDALAHGGQLARVALAALEFASDRRAAGPSLCALIARADAGSLAPLLAALLDVVVHAPPIEGSSEPVAEPRCPAVLEELLQRDIGSPADQDRAAAVLARLRSQ